VKQREPLGFVVGVYNVEELVHVAISLLEPRGVEVLVRDDSAAGEAQFVHFYASRLEPRAASPRLAGLLPEHDQDQPRMVVDDSRRRPKLDGHLCGDAYLS
jgi:hypothetical protein